MKGLDTVGNIIGVIFAAVIAVTLIRNPAIVGSFFSGVSSAVNAVKG